MKFKLNNPVPSNMQDECTKCANIINDFAKPEQEKLDMQGMDKYIPASVIQDAKGLAILSVIKAGFGWSGRAGRLSVD